MKAQLEETPDAAGKAELLREKLMPQDALRRGEDYLNDRKRAETLLAGENQILEMVATGKPLGVILDEICRLVDKLSNDSLASILLFDPIGNCLRVAAAPRFPAGFIAAIDGVKIGPHVGSCGTAAYRKEQVIVSDIATDPRWANYRELALTNGLRAGWSTPILSSDGSVLALFGIYWREPRSPAPQHQQLIKQITHLASVAIERKQAAESLRASELLARGQLEALTHTLDALAQESDPDRLLEHVLRTIIEQSDAHSVSVWDREPDGDWLELFAMIEDGRFQTRSGAIHPAAKLAMLAQDHPVWREILHTGLHAVIEDIDQPVVRMCVGFAPNATWHDILDEADLAPAMMRFKSHLREMGRPHDSVCADAHRRTCFWIHRHPVHFEAWFPTGGDRVDPCSRPSGNSGNPVDPSFRPKPSVCRDGRAQSDGSRHSRHACARIHR